MTTEKQTPEALAAETVPVPVADLMKLKALTNFNTSALAAAVSAMASEWLTAPPAVEKTRPGFIPQDASIQVTHWPELPAVEKREPLTLRQLHDAARQAQIDYCLDKFSNFQVALARAIERAHGITPADAKEGE